MGLFSFSLGGSKKKTSGEQKTTGTTTSNQVSQQTTAQNTTANTTAQQAQSQTQNTQQQVSGQQTSTGTQSQTASGSSQETSQQQQSQQQTATTSVLDTDTQNILKDLIQQLSQNSQNSDIVGGAGQVVQSLLARASTAGDDLATQTAAILNAARQTGEQALTANTTAAANAAGSALNTFTQGVNAQGRVQLETQLAGVEGQLNLQNRQAVTGEITNALTQLATIPGIAAADTQAILNVVQLLKGATTTATGTTETQASGQTTGQTTQQAQATTEQQTGTTQQSSTTSQTDALLQSIQQSQQQTESQTNSIQQLVEVVNQLIKQSGTTKDLSAGLSLGK